MPFSFSYIWTAHRRLAIVGLLAALLVATVGLVHAPFVRARVLLWVVERLRADAGIRAQVDHLDYNLVTLRASIGRTRLAADDETMPFLTLESASVDLPWSIVTGRIAIESVEIVRPRITITRDRDGRLNLPATTEPTAESSGPLDPIDIGRLSIRELGIGYVDRPLELSIDGGAVSLEMSRAGQAALAGRLSMSDGVTLALADRETTVSRLDGGLSFDGRALAFDELTLDSPEVRLRLDGRVDLLAEAPRVDARYQGRAVLERLAPWVAPGQALSGAVDFSGAAAGALDAPHVTFAVSGNELAWSDQRGIAFDLQGEASALEATIARLQLTLGGGAIEGRARIGLADRETSNADFTWRRLDLGSLAHTAGVDQVRVAALVDGGLKAEWMGTDPMTATATISADLSGGRAPSDALPLSGRVSAGLERGLWNLALDGLATRSVRLDGEATGRLRADDLAAGTLGGRARAEVEDLRALVDELRRAGIALPEDPPITTGRASVDTALSGTFGSPRAEGTLEASDLEVSGVGPGTLAARFAADPTRISVGSLEFALGPDTANGNLDIDLGTGTLRGMFAADLPRLSPLVTALPPQWQVEGAATLHAEIGGTLERPLVDLVADATALEVAGQRIERFDLTARLADQILSIERLDLSQGDGRLGVAGSYSLSAQRYSFEATGRNLIVRPVPTGDESTLPIDARFDLNLTGEGSIDSPQG